MDSAKQHVLKACAVFKGDGYKLNSVHYVVKANVGTARVNSDVVFLQLM